jgi:predicted RNase H-like nuclease (RuvC/YqgF family)
VKAKKPDKSVAGMAVLQDIRGLLSATRPQPPTEDAKSGAGAEGKSEKPRDDAEVRKLRETVGRQQTLLDRLGLEKKSLEAKVNELESTLAKQPAPAAGAGNLGRDISDLEARKAELETAVSQIEGLLQMKINDLARRIARVYAEAGDIGANRDFRRIRDQLEAAENFGEFVRALLGE